MRGPQALPPATAAAASLAASAIVFASALAGGVGNIQPMLSEQCTESTLPEFSRNLELNRCQLLPRRLVWRSGSSRAPLLIKQTMDPQRLGSQSTGSAVWSGGLALSRYMEEALGREFFGGKRVVELGCGTGLASITAADLGAASVIATDGDASVLKLAQANADDNLGVGTAARAAFDTAVLRWGGDQAKLPAAVRSGGTDLVVGADITYYRDAWPALAAQLRVLEAPALLAVSERRSPNELTDLRAFLDQAELRSTVLDSPMRTGYAKEKVRLFWIDAPNGARTCEFGIEDEYAAEEVFTVKCTDRARGGRASTQQPSGAMSS